MILSTVILPMPFSSYLEALLILTAANKNEKLKISSPFIIYIKTLHN